MLTGVALVAAFRAADPEGFRWREPPYEYERIKLPFDILAGSAALREQIEAGVAAERDRPLVGTGRRRVRARAEAFSPLLIPDRHLSRGTLSTLSFSCSLCLIS